MTPVKQEFVGPNVIGDCLRACTASLLDLALSEVPHFLAEHPGISDDPAKMPNWYTPWENYVIEHGYAPSIVWGPFSKTPKLLGYYFAAGPAQREDGRIGQHVVIMRDGELFHDPHPSNAGLMEVQAIWVFK